jgi:hypothetical protein
MRDILKILIHCSMILAAGCASSNSKTDIAAKQDSTPKLKRPEVRKVWVSDEIVGDEYITGHWKYIIQKNTAWAKEDK